MSNEFKRLTSVDMRSLGLDEKWLQEQIVDDPTLLGLGELEIAAKEHRQPVGGRIDFLMRDAEAETYYEVEVMLGRLDESHIIRTIEYWDIERQRRPQFDHRAVIVAEQITSRFFNVIRLLNRAVPLIAVQLNAFQLPGDAVGLLPVTVLDITEETTNSNVVIDEERTDRAYWERKVDLKSLGIVDEVASLLRTGGVDPRLTYNRHHIAMATSGYKFCWLHPRKTPGHCHVQFRVDDSRDAILLRLQDAGVDASPRRGNGIAFGCTMESLVQHADAIRDALRNAEQQSER
jgi:hypothetical protein